jgi:hypothetical protein
MSIQSETPSQAIGLDREERRKLRLLRARYRRDRDFFTSEERARLAFLRWLYRTGRLVP